jgi:alpha-1,2-mannosyltransferase
MDWHGGLKSATGIMWFGIGALLGWPFAGALILPFVAEEWLLAILGPTDIFETFLRYLDGIVRCLIVLVLQVSIDAFFFHKVTIVPWNIVAYNVFGGQDRGPDIFGTEPWHYYARNLLLNFNIWFLLATLSVPLYLMHMHDISGQIVTKQSPLRILTFLAPFYLWYTIFTLQPHKEERFMFPAYPFLAFNAAIGAHCLLVWIGSPNSMIVGKISAKLKFAALLPVVLVSLNVGLLRIVGTVTGYQAPLQIYSALSTSNTTASDTVCFGKDWYRFPSSHFLPNRVHAKFVKSEFDGLLPGEFHEGATGFGFFSGTWLVPPGMNDRNIEDPGKYIDVRHCTYLVDSYMPGMQATKHEPVYALGHDQWDRVKCAPFLDTAKTGILARTIWIPDLPFIPAHYRRHWGEHCLLRQRQS